LNGTTLFGTTAQGGAAGDGTIFKLNTDGSAPALLASFGSSDAVNPNGGLLISGNVIYGTTPFGGTAQNGAVFRVNEDGTGYQVLHNFSVPVNGINTDGALPTQVTLALGSGTLYGTAQVGGSASYGTVWAVNTDGSGFSTLKNFSNSGTDGAYPTTGLLLSCSTLYGTTSGGGSAQFGTVFKINTDGSGYSVIKGFTGAVNDGATPQANLILSGSTLYGTTFGGGPSAYGSVFKINIDGTGFATLKSYNSAGTVGTQPEAGLLLIGSTLYGTTSYGGTAGNGTVFKINTDGSGFTNFYNFSALDIHSANPDGAHPQGTLALNGGALYGTASAGGTNAYGTVYKINPDGTGFTVLYTFSLSSNGDNSDGRLPSAGAVFSGNTLYGTASNGGNLDDGTIFSLALSASLSPIPLNIQLSGSSAVLTWTNAAFGLQASPVVPGTFTNVPSATSPYTTPAGGPQQFFRSLGTLEYQ